MRNPKGKILIVDDEPDILLMLRANLESDGYETLIAGDGETAVRRTKEEKPDLIILDIMMPVLDGWGVLEKLATLDIHPPVVVLTAKSGERDLTRAWELGADDYITKPFDPESLIETVGEILSNQNGEKNSDIKPLYSPPED